ncbi:cancer-related nucleoside-triphosphatase [Candidatus Desulfofervidus auxilii]|uniref:Cancer-related nucleoside-triphosphatase n=1 Tax=Desulfofervidus auxilii TaxID=1621989 RepID=A0A7U4QLV7_DESA2|nr:NTPase [Candidatus Desulfofervidus auxilii]AMM41756.1 cancer-related nucleoside-triphosphatase [Candidatus Desulfofervidus auxilii]
MTNLKILITGPPRIGKTTIIKKITQFLKERKYPLRGFYTEEIKEKGKRLGFKLVTLDGKEIIFSHVDIESPYKVGKYKVDVLSLENHLSILIPLCSEEIIIIDEIGKMECFSQKFRKVIWDLFFKPNPILGSISLKGNKFIEKIKHLPQVRLMEVNQENRNILVETIITEIALKSIKGN